MIGHTKAAPVRFQVSRHGVPAGTELGATRLTYARFSSSVLKYESASTLRSCEKTVPRHWDGSHERKVFAEYAILFFFHFQRAYVTRLFTDNQVGM